jgi:uncharacterized protein YegL
MDTALRGGPGGAPEEPDFGEQLFESSREFVDNPEPRCPCVLLLDNSSSMAGAPLAALNEGLRAFRDELEKDPLARQRVEVALVTFGSPVEVVQPFAPVADFYPPALAPRGQTPLGTGILQALDLLDARKVRYRAHGVPYSRPWLFLITDGMPQGEPWETTREAVRRLRAEEEAGRLVVFAVGVGGANMKFLARLAARPPLRLDGLRFVDLFLWLSASTERMACSPAEDQVSLPPVEWGSP